MSAELARAGLKVVALERGAPRDTDKDGLVDGVDRCPRAHAITEDGCPLGDTDGA